MQTDWFVLKTKPHRERLVASLLSDRGMETYLPLVRTLRDQHPSPLFPGYVFALLDPQAGGILETRSAPGVSYILRSDGQPAIVAADVVEAIRRGVESRGGLLVSTFARGEEVRIMGGPFAGLEAVFDGSLSPAGRSRVLISILGRQTPLLLGDNLLARVG